MKKREAASKPVKGRRESGTLAGVSLPSLSNKTKHPNKNPKEKSNDSLLDLYLEEISRIPMLNRDEEIELAKRAKRGDKEARDRLVKANLRFVVSVARKYQSSGLSIMDLINEGNIGLLIAAERSNPERGFHFISYAVWWIKQSILYAIGQRSRLIRIPLNRIADLRRFEELEHIYENQSDSATFKILAKYLKIKERDLQHLLNINKGYVSLESVISSKEGIWLYDTLEDTALSPDLLLERDEFLHDIEECMSELTSKEKRVITLRFGLSGESPLSLNVIGKMLGLSKERIRQIEKHVLHKIRSGKYFRRLELFLG